MIVDYSALFEPEPPYLCMYEVDGQYTVVNIADPGYPRMILPTKRHLACAWALAFKTLNPEARLDSASFAYAEEHSVRVPSNVYPIRMHEALDDVG